MYHDSFISCSKKASLLLSLLLIVGISGCGSHIQPTRAHAATTPDQVKIYAEQPKTYEVLGPVRVDASPQVTWDERANVDAGFDQMKSLAAAQGANGVLLIAPKGQADANVVAGYHGTYYQVPVTTNPKAAIVQAIWVVGEE